MAELGGGTDVQVNARIIYWGIPGCGKRTNLEGIHAKLRSDHRGELREMPTRIDPSVTYLMMPIELGNVGGVRTRIQVITAPTLRRSSGRIVNAARIAPALSTLWRIDVEPSFLSKVERGIEPPPSEEKIVALARDLGEDPDVLLALAGKVSSDLKKIICRRPALFAQLIRDLKKMPAGANDF